MDSPGQLINPWLDIECRYSIRGEKRSSTAWKLSPFCLDFGAVLTNGTSTGSFTTDCLIEFCVSLIQKQTRCKPTFYTCDLILFMCLVVAALTLLQYLQTSSSGEKLLGD